MTQFRLLALDLDGTLIRDDLFISEQLKETLKKARERGVTVVIASGRMHRSAAMLAREMGLSGPLISFQGAMVRDIASGEVFYHNPLPVDLANEFVAEAMARNYHVHIYHNDEIYVSKMTEEASEYGNLNRHMPLVVGNLLDFMERESVQPTKALVITNPDNTTRFLADMQARFSPQLYITRSYPTFTDAVNATSSKGAALAALAEKLGIAREQVMAIGDNLNDVPMLEYAGLAVAVGNATAPAKAIAGYVAQKEFWEGAVEAIEKFILV